MRYTWKIGSEVEAYVMFTSLFTIFEAVIVSEAVSSSHNSCHCTNNTRSDSYYEQYMTTTTVVLGFESTTAAKLTVLYRFESITAAKLTVLLYRESIYGCYIYVS